MNMFGTEEAAGPAFQPSPYLGLAVGIAVIGLFALGVYPDPLVQASESAAEIFAA
jgi:hypothetical protein